MIKLLFNPFKFIAGKRALFLGMLVILLTGIIGYYSHVHFPDVISVKLCLPHPLHYFIIQSFANWIIISTLLYIASVAFSKSKIRIIDVFGTQALARFPYFIAAFTGFSDAMENFGKYTMWQFMKHGEPVEMSSAEMGMAIFLIVLTLALTAWLIALMYNAFRVSANIKGGKAVLLFIVALIIAFVISALITRQLLQIL